MTLEGVRIEFPSQRPIILLKEKGRGQVPPDLGRYL